MMNLGRSCSAHELHYELVIVFTQFLNDTDLQHIRETFLSMDEDHTGSIEIEELRDAFEQIKKRYEDEKAKSAIGVDPENQRKLEEMKAVEGLTSEKIQKILESVD